MKLRRLGLFALAALACGELVAPGRPVALSLVPVFHEAAAASFADNADRLRVRIERDSLGTFVPQKDTTVQLDADGSVTLDLTVVLLQSPQLFRVVLTALRSSDGAVLFSGTQQIQVTSSSASTPQAVEIPVSYTGPTGTRLDITPADTALAAGTTMTFRALVTDDAGVPVPSPVNYLLVTPADSTRLVLNRLSGVAAARAGASGFVRVYGSTPNGLRDTAQVFIGLQTTGVRITPGQLGLVIGGTGTLQAAVLDQNGQPISGASVTWTSRNPAVASVSGGTVSGVAAGTATVVATSGSFGDSVMVAVAAPGAVFVNATIDGRTYRSPRVGDTVAVEFGGDLSRAGGDKLASYNVRYTFDPARLAFVDTVAAGSGAFAASVVNTDSVAQGVLRFAGVNTSGVSGAFPMLRARFRSVAAGAGSSALEVREASGPAPTLVNLLSRVTVINGTVTVRP